MIRRNAPGRADEIRWLCVYFSGMVYLDLVLALTHGRGVFWDVLLISDFCSLFIFWERLFFLVDDVWAGISVSLSSYFLHLMCIDFSHWRDIRDSDPFDIYDMIPRCGTWRGNNASQSTPAFLFSLLRSCFVSACCLRTMEYNPLKSHLHRSKTCNDNPRLSTRPQTSQPPCNVAPSDNGRDSITQWRR